MVLWSAENDQSFYFVKRVEIVNKVDRKFWSVNDVQFRFFVNCGRRSHTTCNNAKSTKQWKLQNNVYY